MQENSVIDNTPKTSKPKVSNHSQRELDKAEVQFQKFDEEVKTMTLDRLNETPREETESRMRLSSKEVEKKNGTYLKPITSFDPAANPRTGLVTEKFNEKFRAEYNFQKEYVNFSAHNNEIIGEDIEIWTKPFPGMPAEQWKVPVNKPVWGPRYLAEQIKRKFYHRLVMNENRISHSSGEGQYFGTMSVDTTIPRLDCHPVSDRKSIFMGAASF